MCKGMFFNWEAYDARFCFSLLVDSLFLFLVTIAAQCLGPLIHGAAVHAVGKEGAGATACVPWAPHLALGFV